VLETTKKMEVLGPAARFIVVNNSEADEDVEDDPHE
jgi:hypothetical protein